MKLEAWELFDLKLRRLNKPKSKALPTYQYGDPAKTVQFESEKRGRHENNTAVLGSDKFIKFER